MKNGQPQRCDKRLFMQLLAFTGLSDVRLLAAAIARAAIAGVLYEDVNDPRGVALLTLSEDPGFFIDRVRPLLDLREQVISFDPQPVITEDNLVVNIDTVLYFQITDPKSATYEIANPVDAIDMIPKSGFEVKDGRLLQIGAPPPKPATVPLAKPPTAPAPPPKPATPPATPPPATPPPGGP